MGAAKEKAGKEKAAKEKKGKEAKAKEVSTKEKKGKETRGKEKKKKENLTKEVNNKENLSKERANKAPCPPETNPVSGKPCGSVAGPICHGYNLRCFKTSSLAKCKASCEKDKRCNLAEWKPSTKHCCDSAIATKKGCTAAGKKVGRNARWARASGWTGYTICRGHAEEITAKKVLKGRLSPKCEKKSKEKKAKESKAKENATKEARLKREKKAKEAVSKEKKQKEVNTKEKKGKETRGKEKKKKEKSNKERNSKEKKSKEVRNKREKLAKE